VIQVGSEVEGITEEQMQQLLSIPDIRTVERGDTVSFVVGAYDALPEAIRRQLQLSQNGIQARVMVQEGNKLIDASAEVAAAQAGMQGEAPEAPSEKGRSVMRVQLGAFKNKVSKNIFAGIPDIMTIRGDDGLTRYYTGSFTNVNDAARRRVDMLTKGFSGAFIVAFKDGKRVSLREAGAKVTGPETLKDTPGSGFDKNLVRYRVQLGSFVGNVPADVMDTYVELGNVEPITGTEDTRYVYGSFKTRAEAAEALKLVQEKGVPDAFVVGEMQGRIISAEDADRLLNE
jgi:cell division protein FtsN